MIIGWVNIYAAVYNDEHTSILDITQNYGRQLIWITTSIVLAVFILVIDGKFYEAFAYPLYATVLIILLGVLLFGREVSGSRSWFEIGGDGDLDVVVGRFRGGAEIWINNTVLPDN